jgi:hypothetical protein
MIKWFSGLVMASLRRTTARLFDRAAFPVGGEMHSQRHEGGALTVLRVMWQLSRSGLFIQGTYITLVKFW